LPAAAVWDAVVAEFDAVDLALSRFRDDSELTAINRLAGTGRVVTVSWRLRVALAAIHRAGRITEGRFDASVLDVLEAIGERGAALAGQPSSNVRRIAAPGETRVSRVTVPGRPVDLGGIGKGLALRWSAASAAPLLPVGAGLLIEAGGDVVAAGQGPAEGWMIGIDDPIAADSDGGPVAVLALQHGAVSTSSIGTRRWTGPDGRAVHHLVDPSTREPARTGLLAVTVAAPDPAWAEVWTKALFLAGAERIGEEARGRGLAAWWLDSRGRLSMTPAARAESPWVSEERVA
jgi:thiamine biosynthesis lipoprotein